METMKIEEFIQEAADYYKTSAADVMNTVIDSKEISFTSGQLFEYVKKEDPNLRYDNFNRSLVGMLKRLNINPLPQFEVGAQEMSNRNETVIVDGITVVTKWGKLQEYVFNRRWSLIVASLFDLNVRIAVIDRMIELEQEVARLNKEMADKFERYLSGNPLFIRVRDLQRHMRLNNADYKAVMEYMQDESVTGKYAFRKSLLTEHLVETITFTNAANVQLEVHSVSPRMVLKLDDWLKLTPAQRGIRGKK